MNQKEEFYQKLKETLLESTTFPTTYLFKFILPNNNLEEEKLLKLFDLQGAVISTKDSKTNKYKSFTINIVMYSVEDVILKYKEASTIKGIISL
jgi:putative lipoic acid-binding regulatory protein